MQKFSAFENICAFQPFIQMLIIVSTQFFQQEKIENVSNSNWRNRKLQTKTRLMQQQVVHSTVQHSAGWC